MYNTLNTLTTKASSNTNVISNPKILVNAIAVRRAHQIFIIQRNEVLDKNREIFLYLDTKLLKRKMYEAVN